jgi:tetratricopeptide (TPR) repeat protein
MQIIQAQGQGPATDISHILLQPAAGLETFAASTNKKQLAALALIKQAEALRAEVHFGTADKMYIAEQINKAKDCYTKAIEKSPANPTLTALAQFGLGLCDEELGNFDKAKEIYRQVTENPDYKGTIAVIQAQFRLDTIDDYTQDITFKPEPKPAAVQAPATQSQPADLNMASDTTTVPTASTDLPIEFKLVDSAPNSISAEPNQPFDISNLVTEIPIINPESKSPNNPSAIQDANSSGK